MPDGLDLACQVCGHVGLDDGANGFFYCQECGSQAVDIRDTAPDEEIFEDREFFNTAGAQRRRPTTAVLAEPISQSQPQSQFWESLRTQEQNEDVGDGVGPTTPGDFGSSPRKLKYEDYYSEIRLRYLMGVQIMIQLQLKALVENFQVSPLIVGLAEPIWLRFVASTRICADSWADDAIHESESQKQGQADDNRHSAKHHSELHNSRGQQAVMIWYRHLSKTIPLSYSLVISFLACHVAREAVLPTDILKLTLEGKLPYFAAFVEIEKQIGPPSNACPISASRMFRPMQAIPLQKLESLAASVAQKIGLKLPPVNFYAIASRFLRKLSLPVAKILPHACRIHEWSMPPELWLSANELRLPTRVCVMSILIVAIRIIYDLNGFGKWEVSVSASSSDQNGEAKPSCNIDTDDDSEQGSPGDDLNDTRAKHCSNQAEVQQSEFDAAELLLNLEAKYDELADPYEFSKDLPTYLQYCKDVVFAGLEPSFEDHEEQKMIEDLWDFYQKKKGSEQSDDRGIGSLERSCGDHKRSRDDSTSPPKESKKYRENGGADNPLEDGFISHGDNCSQNNLTREHLSCKEPSATSDAKSNKERAIRRLRLDMEENRFYYIPPRVKVKRLDYLQYMRKRDDGAFTYAVHADYYILLRSCARVVKVDGRSLHFGILSFEKRLDWLEKRIDHCLHMNPLSDTCQFCSDEGQQNARDDPINLSNLNL
ncbi:hypothetical protein RJ640_007869 [Escallonia rubra]|uniref:Rrn7/TAF1B N-terminal cyclin domain-containing protein n=1 Tax=Escallonia rubra TaxID=112253 RepID=A0AA88QEK3_9ASTE|nr:hypothetical protein RJ640_007869 [Escallonia rubra]